MADDKKSRGRPPQTFKTDMPWEEALKKALSKKPSPKGKAKRGSSKSQG